MIILEYSFHFLRYYIKFMFSTTSMFLLWLDWTVVKFYTSEVQFCLQLTLDKYCAFGFYLVDGWCQESCSSIGTSEYFH